MTRVHVCCLPQKASSGLPRLPPNASPYMRLARWIRELIVLNPKNFRCNAFFYNKSAVLAEQRRHINSSYNYIIHPFSTLNAFFEVLFCVLWMAKMLADPMVDNMIGESEAYDVINYYGVNTVQKVLILSFFFVGYIDFKAKEIVIEPWRVGNRYLKTYFFFDIIACDFFYVLSMAIIGKLSITEETRNRVTKLFLFAHVPCLYIRLGTVLDYLDDIGIMLKLQAGVRKLLTYLVRTFMCLHFFCCLVYLVPHIVYGDVWPKDSWLVKAKIYPQGETPVYKIYGETMLMTVCLFFGASVDRFLILQTNEQVCASLISLFGRLYTLFLLADTLNTFGLVGVSESNYERKMAEVQEYMASNSISRDLRNRMVTYFKFKYQKRFFKEHDILNSLSDTLRAEIYLFSARTLLYKSNVFKAIPQSEVATLISMMRLETFARGDILVKSGEEASEIYLISWGTVAITKDDGLELCHLEDGDIAGLCRAVTGVNEYSSVVIETSDVFVVKLNDWLQFLDQYPVARYQMNRMARDRLADLMELEKIALRKATTCLIDLRLGKLLETRKKRPVIS